MNAKIILTPGDGVGPEVVHSAVQIFQAVAGRFGHHFDFETHLIGGCSIDATGVPLTEDTLEACKKAKAVLLGAVGGPKWDNPLAAVRPEQGLLALRKGLGVFANLRPVKLYPSLIGASPLKPEILAGVDLVVVRELTGGLYFGQPKGRFEENGQTRAVDTLEYYDYEIERIIELAFQVAKTRKSKVTSVDKANVLESSRLWRQIASKIGEKYPEVNLEHMLVDTAAMRLVARPSDFDVIVTENMFGDILTDEAAVLAGSMGLLPSASISVEGPGLYEPIHGSAPDIAGKGIANPYGTILSAAMMLRHSFKLFQEADLIDQEVKNAIEAGILTVDLGGNMTTDQVTDRLLSQLG